MYRLCDNKANGQILRSATPILEPVGQVLVSGRATFKAGVAKALEIEYYSNDN